MKNSIRQIILLIVLLLLTAMFCGGCGQDPSTATLASDTFPISTSLSDHIDYPSYAPFAPDPIPFPDSDPYAHSMVNNMYKDVTFPSEEAMLAALSRDLLDPASIDDAFSDEDRLNLLHCGLRQMGYYFHPGFLPESASLEEIQVSSFGLAYVFSVEGPQGERGYIHFTWYMHPQLDHLYPDTPDADPKTATDYYIRAIAENGSHEITWHQSGRVNMSNPDGSSVAVEGSYWFLGEFPGWMEPEESIRYCNMEQVLLSPPDTDHLSFHGDVMRFFIGLDTWYEQTHTELPVQETLVLDLLGQSPEVVVVEVDQSLWIQTKPDPDTGSEIGRYDPTSKTYTQLCSSDSDAVFLNLVSADEDFIIWTESNGTGSQCSVFIQDRLNGESEEVKLPKDRDSGLALPDTIFRHEDFLYMECAGKLVDPAEIGDTFIPRTLTEGNAENRMVSLYRFEITTNERTKVADYVAHVAFGDLAALREVSENSKVHSRYTGVSWIDQHGDAVYVIVEGEILPIDPANMEGWFPDETIEEQFLRTQQSDHPSERFTSVYPNELVLETMNPVPQRVFLARSQVNTIGSIQNFQRTIRWMTFDVSVYGPGKQIDVVPFLYKYERGATWFVALDSVQFTLDGQGTVHCLRADKNLVYWCDAAEGSTSLDVAWAVLP